MLTSKHISASRRLLDLCGDIGPDGMPHRDREKPEPTRPVQRCVCADRARRARRAGLDVAEWWCEPCGGPVRMLSLAPTSAEGGE